MSSLGESGALLSGSSSTAATSASRPIGMFTRKIARQSVPNRFALISRPPSSGPRIVAIPMVAPKMPNALPRSLAGIVTWITASTWGNIKPLPSPCRIRARTSVVAFGASPHSALATVNVVIPARNSLLRPKMSPRRAPVMSRQAKASW